MKKALILTLDMGTSSIRAMLFDAQGRALPGAEVQIPYAQTTTGDGGVETEAEALLSLTVQCIRQLLKDADKETLGRIAGVGISCFWHSLVGIGGDGLAVTPLFSWADTRSQKQAEKLQTELDEKAYHARTGCVLHTSYWPAKLRWLHETQESAFGKVQHWMSFGEYAAQRLFGETKCSLSMASGTGLFNPNANAWDAQTLRDLPITQDQLTPLAASGESQSGVTGEWAQALGILKDLPWFPAWGDGACSNIGSGATNANRIAINVGTSGAMRVAVQADHVDIPEGLFCYRVDGERLLIGGAFANGGNVYAWAQKTLQLGDRKAAARAIAAQPPDGHGLTVLPFWAGERSPGWHVGARAAITGMNLHTTPQDILQASLEAVAYGFAAVRDLLLTQYPTAIEIVASGGALVHDPTWTQMMADTFGVPLTTSRVFEASSRGAALLASHSLGLLPDLGDVPAYLGKTYTPDTARHEIYTKARARQEALYTQMLGETKA
jgi:gluconokinase